MSESETCKPNTGQPGLFEYIVVNQFGAIVVSEGKELVFDTYAKAYDALAELVERYGADAKFDVETRRK